MTHNSSLLCLHPASPLGVGEAEPLQGQLGNDRRPFHGLRDPGRLSPRENNRGIGPQLLPEARHEMRNEPPVPLHDADMEAGERVTPHRLGGLLSSRLVRRQGDLVVLTLFGVVIARLYRAAIAFLGLKVTG